jgi:hypothetical protein
VADRVRVAASRKRGGAKRPAKKKRVRSRRLGIFGLVILAVMIMGFLTRRVMLPSAVHYLAHRAPDSPVATTDDGARSDSSANHGGGDSEPLTNSDRDELNAIIKHKAK